MRHKSLTLIELLKSVGGSLAACVLFLIAGGGPAFAVTPEVTLGNVTGTITRDTDPGSDPECMGNNVCDSFKITAPFTITNGVDFVSDLTSTGKPADQVGVAVGAPGQFCFAGPFWSSTTFSDQVTRKTKGSKTTVSFKGMGTGDNGNARFSVPLTLSIRIDTAKNTGVLSASGTADLSKMPSGMLELTFSYASPESADADVDCSFTNFTPQEKTSK
jgi:hypothetical protein